MKAPLLASLLFAAIACRGGVAHGGAAQPAPAPTPPALPSRGTVVFLGDSITWQHLYTAYVETYLTRRYPERALRFVNRGMRGDTATGARERFDRDVAPLEPDLIIVMLGMNDGGYKGYHRGRLRAYARELARLLDHARLRTGARLVLMTTTCLDRGDHLGREYNRLLGDMAREARTVAAARGIPVVDLFPLFSAKLAEAHRADPPIQLMADAIHPGPAGHLLIAHQLLELLEAAAPRPPPALRPSARHSDGGWELRFTHPQRNGYLPPAARPALALVPFQARFNAQLLRASGIAGRVRLLLDGRSLAEVDGAELAAGLDLNLLDAAPWVEQAAHRYQLVRERWRWQYALWDPRDLGPEVLLDMSTSGLAPARVDRAAARQELARVTAELAALPSGARTYTLSVQPVPAP